MTDERYARATPSLPPAVRAVGGIVLLAVIVTIVISLLMRDGGTTATPGNQGTTTGTATSTIDATGSVTPTDAAAPDGLTYVTVVADGLKLRDQPSRDGSIVKSLTAGQTLLCLETSSGWYRVRDGEGIEGWVAAGPEYSELVQP
jgi:uncharacterized protein YgiM (DUF1202 family)